MKQIPGPQVFGEVTDRFDACIADALRQEEKPMKQKRKIPALVLALVLIFALACTALAVAHRVGLLDVLYIYDPADGDDIEDMIVRDIAQEGGQMERATCTAREALYDGRTVYFLVEIVPTREGDAFVYGNFMNTIEALEEAAPYGDTFIGARMDAVIRGTDGMEIYGFYLREGATLVMSGSRMLPDAFTGESLTVEATITLLDRESGEPLEQTALTFDIPRMATPDVQRIEADLALDIVEIQTIEVARTPVDTLISITCRPLLRAFHDINRIPEDGRVRYLRYSNYYTTKTKPKDKDV